MFLLIIFQSTLHVNTRNPKECRDRDRGLVKFKYTSVILSALNVWFIFQY